MSSFRVALLCVLAGCSRPGEENLGLQQKAAAAIDPAQLTQPAQLVRALAMPGAARDAQLGAHRFEAIGLERARSVRRPVLVFALAIRFGLLRCFAFSRPALLEEG